MMPPIYLNAMTVDRAPLGDIFRAAAAAGFSGIELWAHHIVPHQLAAADLDGLRARYGPPIDFDLRPRDVVSLAEQFGLKVDGVVPGLDFMFNWIDGLTAARIGALQSMLPSFAEIGARYMVLPVLNGDGARRAIGPSLARVCQILAPFGLTAALEPIGHVARLSRVEDAVEVLAQLPAQHRAGLVIDAFHFFRGGNQLDVLAQIPLDQIVTVQINDAEDRPLAELFGHQHRLHPGHGIFDVQGFCGALLAQGYTGPFVSEVMNERYWRQGTMTVCADTYTACCTVLGQRRGDATTQNAHKGENRCR